MDTKLLVADFFWSPPRVLQIVCVLFTHGFPFFLVWEARDFPLQEPFAKRFHLEVARFGCGTREVAGRR